MYSKLFADAFAKLLIITILLSAVGGWALIEGLIWIYHHVSVAIQ